MTNKYVAEIVVSDSFAVRAYIASKSVPFGSVSSYGMVVVYGQSSAEFWGLQRAAAVTLEMHAAYRLLSAIEDAGLNQAKVDLIAKSRQLATRIHQTLDAMQKVQAKRTIGFAQERARWFETARLWQSHKVGLGMELMGTKQDRAIFSKARKLAISACEPERATHDLIDDGRECTFEKLD